MRKIIICASLMLISAIAGFVLILFTIRSAIPVFEANNQEATQQAASQPITAETKKPTAGATKPKATATQAATPPETMPQETVPQVQLYAVPLSKDLQIHIINTCEKYHVDPVIVLAMIWQESNFDASVMGDGGDSYGLMQIQPKWTAELMQELGCTNLLDPYQNVTVGVAVLADKLSWYSGDIEKALVAYNAGHYNGIVTDYALDVLYKASRIASTRQVD